MSSKETTKKRILVTGANSGIGLALTKQLVADHGCFVYLGARNAEKGAKAVEDVKAEAGDSVELLTIDVGSDESVKAAASDLESRLGDEKLYAIVNNAGTGISHGTSLAGILDTNTRGPRRVVNAFLPLLDSSIGRIVNVGSGAGPMYFDKLESEAEKKRHLNAMSEDEIEEEIKKLEAKEDDFLVYAGSKALLACYTIELANEHPNLMISVITPGFINTSLTSGYGASKEPKEGTVPIRKCLFEDLTGSGYFWGSDGLRSPLHYLRNPGEPEYDGELPSWAN